MSEASRGYAVLRSDAAAGVLVMLVAVLFFYGAWKLRTGTLERMGPGYVPLVVASFLFLLGGVLTIRSLRKRSNQAQFPALRPTMVVVLSPVLFALLISRVGLVITVLIVSSFARLAQPQKRSLEMFVLPVLLTVFCVIVFSYLLNLTIPLWP
jgi:hypothetical protein